MSKEPPCENDMGHFGNQTGAEMISCWTLVRLLTQDEASSVTISNANPDFGGPNYIIDVSGPWTHYKDRRFHGDTILECLDSANRARVAALKSGAPE